MLEGKTRIPPADVETLPDDLRAAVCSRACNGTMTTTPSRS